jgi:hypothetical protein
MTVNVPYCPYSSISAAGGARALCRTYYRDHDRVQFASDPSLHQFFH